jgi:hypothetical protein
MGSALTMTKLTVEFLFEIAAERFIKKSIENYSSPQEIPIENNITIIEIIQGDIVENNQIITLPEPSIVNIEGKVLNIPDKYSISGEDHIKYKLHLHPDVENVSEYIHCPHSNLSAIHMCILPQKKVKYDWIDYSGKKTSEKVELILNDTKI